MCRPQTEKRSPGLQRKTQQATVEGDSIEMDDTLNEEKRLALGRSDLKMCTSPQAEKRSIRRSREWS